MLVKLDSVLFTGLEVAKVVVEVNLSSRGIPSFDIVGLGGRSVEESKHRIKAAIQNSGFTFPDKKITVNLAPADVAKEGSFYDLPICMGILSAGLGFSIPEGCLFYGELSLNGDIRYSRGSFLAAVYAREGSYKNVYMSSEGATESAGALDSSIKCYGVKNISRLIKHLVGKDNLLDSIIKASVINQDSFSLKKNSYKYMVGQEQLKRALLISAAGGHNLIMVGPPGSGKSLGAGVLSEFLPPLSDEESFEVTKIYSLMGAIPKGTSLIRERPFRQPHHTASYAGIIGGGNIPVPGEITLAHKGVLFLDEFNEFNRGVLEALRQPMEKAKITLSRGRGSITYPSDFTLVAAANPCPCGFNGDLLHECKCPPNRVEQYRRKMSGPVMDRIDLHVQVRPVKSGQVESLFSTGSGTIEMGAQKTDIGGIRNSVIKAREAQRKRFVGTGIIVNSRMDNELVISLAPISLRVRQILNSAMERMGFSARVYFKLIKIARTIADIESSDEIEESHILEAIQYRVYT